MRLWATTSEKTEDQDGKEGSRKGAAAGCHSHRVSRSWAKLQINLSAAAAKNNQLSKAYQDLKAQFDELEGSCQEREEQLAQAQQDANKDEVSADCRPMHWPTVGRLSADTLANSWPTKWELGYNNTCPNGNWALITLVVTGTGF